MVCRIKGVIRQESRTRGYLQLDVLSTIMDIRIIRMTKKINRLRITVKNEGEPKIDMAKEIFSKVIAGGARLSEQ
jgi:archaeosine-15-forming tRNA-guanine transglycosylase